jgi:hypothetical protein
LVGTSAPIAIKRKIILNYTRAYFEQIPHLSLMVDDDARATASSFELNNQVDINILTSSFRAVRGRAVLAALLDECAFWRVETSTNPDLEICNGLRPGLASLPGAMLKSILPRRVTTQRWRESGFGLRAA